MADKILSIVMSIFGPAFVKRLILRILVSLQEKAAGTENSIDDLILDALIEAFGGEVDDDHKDGEPVTSADVVHSQKAHKPLAGDPRIG